MKSDDIAQMAVSELRTSAPTRSGPRELNDGSVKSAEINDGTIATVDIADGAVNSAKILDQSVTGTDLSGTGFGSNGFNGDEEIIDGTITGFDIAANQIGGGHVIDGSLSGARHPRRAGLRRGNQNAAVVTVAGGSGRTWLRPRCRTRARASS